MNDEVFSGMQLDMARAQFKNCDCINSESSSPGIVWALIGLVRGANPQEANKLCVSGSCPLGNGVCDRHGYVQMRCTGIHPDGTAQVTSTLSQQKTETIFNSRACAHQR